MDPTRPPREPGTLSYQLAVQEARAEVLSNSSLVRQAVLSTVRRVLNNLELSGELRPGGRPSEPDVLELLCYSDRVDLRGTGATPRMPEKVQRRYERENRVIGLPAALRVSGHGGCSPRHLFLSLFDNDALPPSCLAGFSYLPRGGYLNAHLLLRSSNAAQELLLDLVYFSHLLIGECEQSPTLVPGDLFFTASSLHRHPAGEAGLDLLAYLEG